MIFSDQYTTEEFKHLESELMETIGYDDMDLSLTRMEIAKRKIKSEANL
jgi:hypothetical protein